MNSSRSSKIILNRSVSSDSLLRIWLWLSSISEIDVLVFAFSEGGDLIGVVVFVFDEIFVFLDVIQDVS